MNINWDQNWLKPLLIVALIIYGLSFLVRFLTPTVIEDSSFENVNNTTFENITFDGTRPNFPTELPIATTESRDVTQIILERLATAFSLESDPQFPTVFFSETHSVSYIKDFNQIYFDKQKTVQDTSDFPTINLETATPIAENFVKEYLPEFSVSPITSLITYHTADIHLTATSNISAQVIKLPFSYTVADYPVYFETQSQPPIVVFVDGKKEVSKVIIIPEIIQLQEGNSYSRISIDQAISEINNNNATVISFADESYTIFDLSQVSSGTFSSVAIEYRVNKKTNQLIPYYSFSGAVQTVGNTTVNARVITPAIKI